MNMTATERYEAMRASLHTGDIVLFSGKGRVSNVIKWASKTPWSHVGMVYKMHSDTRVMVAESTTLSDISDVITGKRSEGVQIVPLSQRLVKYDGAVAIRQISGTRSMGSLEAIDGWIRMVHQRPYEKSTWQLIKAQYDGFLLPPNEEDFSSLFCSELVAEALQVMGALDGATPANEYVPADFSEENGTFQPVLLPGFAWSRQVTLKEED